MNTLLDSNRYVIYFSDSQKPVWLFFPILCLCYALLFPRDSRQLLIHGLTPILSKTCCETLGSKLKNKLILTSHNIIPISEIYDVIITLKLLKFIITGRVNKVSRWSLVASLSSVVHPLKLCIKLVLKSILIFIRFVDLFYGMKFEKSSVLGYPLHEKFLIWYALINITYTCPLLPQVCEREEL